MAVRTRAIGIGAVALFLVSGWFMMIRMPGESHRGPLPPLSEEDRVLERELRTHVHRLAGQIGERNVFRYERLAEAAEYLAGMFSSFGYEVRRQSYEVSGRECDNLEVEVVGSSRPDEIVLIGAHYDSVQGSPGANDNATGVAALLSLARRFSMIKSPRTLRFVAFTNEEPPFFQTSSMGSLVYAKRSRARGEKIVAMLSLETMGYYSDKAGSQSYPFPLTLVYPSTANFIAFVSNARNGPLVRELVKTFRQQVRFPSEGAALWAIIPGVGWSDHWAFWAKGFPSAMVTDTALFRYPAYHSRADTPEKIQYDRLARVVSGLQRIVAELARPPSTQGS